MFLRQGVGLLCVCMCYRRVISLGGKVSLFSLTDSMFSMCMAMTRHSSRPWDTHTNRVEEKEMQRKYIPI